MAAAPKITLRLVFLILLLGSAGTPAYGETIWKRAVDSCKSFFVRIGLIRDYPKDGGSQPYSNFKAFDGKTKIPSGLTIEWKDPETGAIYTQLTALISDATPSLQRAFNRYKKLSSQGSSFVEAGGFLLEFEGSTGETEFTSNEPDNIAGEDIAASLFHSRIIHKIFTNPGSLKRVYFTHTHPDLKVLRSITGKKVNSILINNGDMKNSQDWANWFSYINGSPVALVAIVLPTSPACSDIYFVSDFTGTDWNSPPTFGAKFIEAARTSEPLTP